MLSLRILLKQRADFPGTKSRVQKNLLFGLMELKKLYQVEGNCLNISESYFTRGVEYQVYVKAVGNGTKYYSSDFSLPITYQRDLLPELDSPL